MISFVNKRVCLVFKKLGQWKVQPCEKKLKYACKKKGEKINDPGSGKICPPEEVCKLPV